MSTEIAYGQTDLTPLPASGKAKSNDRLPTVTAAMALYYNLKTADELSALNRSTVQAMLDGAAPYNNEALIRSGAGFRHNLNFGEGAAILEAAITAYTDLVDSVEYLASLKLPPAAGDPTARHEVEEVIAEEFHRMVRGWPEFDSYWTRLASEFISHGVSIATFQDDDSWKWTPGGWDDFLIPRQTAATEEAVEVLVARRSYMVHELYNMIEDEAAAKEVGWNVNEVRQNLVIATNSSRGQDMRGWWGDWMQLQKRLKNNDLQVSYADAVAVKTLHFWVRGFDGQYSHYICMETPVKPTTAEFLFKKIDRFQSAANAFTVFSYGVGNGSYHSVRGLAYKIFPMVQTSNRLRCSVLDGTLLSLSMHLQPKDSASMEEPPITVNGPVAYISPEMNVVEKNFGNPAEHAMPIIRDLAMLTQNNSPAYRANTSSATGIERTKYEVQAMQEADTTLSISAINVFYRSWRRVLREMFSRVQRIGPMDERFPEVQEFYMRCMEREVLPEYVMAIRDVEPVKAVGYGSIGHRQVALDAAMSLIGSFDEVGKRNVLRDSISARFGREVADRYLPKIPQTRPVIDEKIAELENAALRGGSPAQVQQGENHAVHAQIHLQSIAEIMQDLEKRRLMGEDFDFMALEPELKFVGALIDHTTPHVEILSQDPMRVQQSAAFREALNNFTASWKTFINQYQKTLRDQQAKAAAPQGSEQEMGAEGEQPEQESEEQKQTAQKQAMELQMLLEKHRVNNQLKAADVMNKIELRKAEADTKMAIQLREQRLKEQRDAGVTPSPQAQIQTPAVTT